MPEYFDTWKGRSTFAEKMEYSFKQAEATDMCQRIISVIAGKYIEQILESHERLDDLFANLGLNEGVSKIKNPLPKWHYLDGAELVGNGIGLVVS